MNDLVKLYNNSSTWSKVLFGVSILLLVVFAVKLIIDPSRNPFDTVLTKTPGSLEGFETTSEFSIKMNDQLYDGFYANIYDNLVFNKIKTEFEVGQIISATTPTSESMILDIGCGTGHTEHGFIERGYTNIVGIDKSKEMIQKAVTNYPNYQFRIADIMNQQGFPYNDGTFTHVLCLYFTIYYMPNKDQFFRNCYALLQPGGYLVVHLVDRNRFDPILPPGNPFYIISPQSYTKDRITKTNVDFNGFEYHANFDLKKEKDTAIFEEKFKRKDNGQVRVNKHTLYMETLTSILQKSQEAGFIIHAIIDMMKVGYDYQYLYVFYKPM